MCRCTHPIWEQDLAHTCWQWVVHTRVCNFNAMYLYDTFLDVVIAFFSCIIYPITSCIKIKWLAVLMCVFHHACCLVFFPPLWWIWAVPLLRHRLRVAQWVWLIDGRQWLSPLESKHFCVVSPLKVLLSLLREKTLFVYSHSDGSAWQLLLKRR